MLCLNKILPLTFFPFTLHTHYLTLKTHVHPPPHTHTLGHTYACTHTHTLSCTYTTHTHTHTHTHTLSLLHITHTHTHTHTHTLLHIHHTHTHHHHLILHYVPWCCTHSKRTTSSNNKIKTECPGSQKVLFSLVLPHVAQTCTLPWRGPRWSAAGCWDRSWCWCGHGCGPPTTATPPRRMLGPSSCPWEKRETIHEKRRWIWISTRKQSQSGNPPVFWRTYLVCFVRLFFILISQK